MGLVTDDNSAHEAFAGYDNVQGFDTNDTELFQVQRGGYCADAQAETQANLYAATTSTGSMSGDQLGPNAIITNNWTWPTT